MYDPFIATLDTATTTVHSEPTVEALFDDVDAVVIVTDHRVFTGYDYQQLVGRMRRTIVVDMRGIIDGFDDPSIAFVSL